MLWFIETWLNMLLFLLFSEFTSSMFALLINLSLFLSTLENLPKQWGCHAYIKLRYVQKLNMPNSLIFIVYIGDSCKWGAFLVTRKYWCQVVVWAPIQKSTIESDICLYWSSIIRLELKQKDGLQIISEICVKKKKKKNLHNEIHLGLSWLIVHLKNLGSGEQIL